MRRTLTILWISAAFVSAHLFCQTTDLKSLQARRISIPPVIDGFQNDDAWQQTIPASDFLQRDPIEGARPTEQTEVRIVYDNEALYFFLMMHDSDPNAIVRRLTRRDDEIESDYISLRIDSYHDHQTASEFTINASGSKTDIIQYDDGNNEDASWDPVWDVKVRILPNGWSAEARIPFQALRYNAQESIWGINIIRRISRKNEQDQWVLIRKTDNGFISRFGHLTGLNDLPTPSHIEVLPYVVGSGEFLPETPTSVRHREFVPNAGFDLKYGITSDFTLDLTVNPDFGQVEADPEVLNLSTFETFYPEKRPFFIEGTQILRFTTFGGDFGPGLFYSRRVGKAIEVDAPEGTLVTEDPRRATILSAAKITGKTRSGLSIGVLEAMTQEEEFTYRDSSNNTMSEVVEPFSNFSLVRLKQDLWENSNIGMIATSVAGESRSPAYTGGLDWNLKFIDAMYTIDGFYAHSRTINKNSGAPREGSAGRIRIGKVGGGHWIYNISSDFTSRQYYINDIGYFRSPNDYGVTSQAEYREYQPGDVLRSYEIGAGVHWRSNFEQVVLNRNIQLESSAQLLNYYLMWIGLNQSFPADDDKESRGLGLYRTPMKYSAEIGFETDDREMVFGGLEQGFTYDLAGQRTWQTGAMIVVRPTSAIDLEFGVDYSRVRNDVAFATRYDDTLAIQKTIAIFGHRDVDEFDLTFRGSLVFSENLTLQVYSQFFAAKYRYDNFSYLESDSRLIAYPYSGSKNSNRTALNTSVVLRWEYLPGSTMYAVWTHGREFFEREGFGRSFPEELDNTFDVPPDNVFMLKISYWFSL